MATGVKASSHIDENDPTSTCAYWRIGLKPNSLSFVNVRFKIVGDVRKDASAFVCDRTISVVRQKILSMFKNF